MPHQKRAWHHEKAAPIPYIWLGWQQRQVFNCLSPMSSANANLQVMWSNKNKFPVSCSECQCRLPAQAEACSECGYPVTGGTRQNGVNDVTRTADLEYKLIQVLGAVVFGAGIVAAIAESPIAATVALTIGGATYLSGLMGAWWNSGD